MLILRRRAGQSFLIGSDVRVTIMATKDKEVQIAIDAPKEVAVLRSELAYAMNANREAAQEESLPQELLAAFSMLAQEPPEGAQEKGEETPAPQGQGK